DPTVILSARAPRFQKKLPRPLAIDATKALIDTVEIQSGKEWVAARDVAVITLLYGCGLRISEALSLTGADAPLPDTLRITGKGGKVAGEGGSQLDIPDGALFGPTVIKLTQVAEVELPHPIPPEAIFIGAVDLDNGGFPFQKEVKLSIPAPAGLPTDAQFFVAQPKIHVNADGSEEEVYVIIDSAKRVDGRITTASPPFAGIHGFGIFTFLMAQPSIGPVTISGRLGDNIECPLIYLKGKIEFFRDD
ncbi:MAG: hypothetical protein L3J63_13185, partial [Geopsychrobacter sp.]|nr:hypothetical protein [Geopsychrobacter sp.]